MKEPKIGWVVVIGLLILYFLVLLTYGNKPVNELPTWAWWMLRG